MPLFLPGPGPLVHPTEQGFSIGVLQVTLDLTGTALDRVGTRALGSLTVNPTLAPTGLAHTRAQGAPTVNPKLAPAGLAHTRTIGDPTVTVVTAPIPTLLRVVQPRRAVRARPLTRILGGLTPAAPSGLAPAGLTHTRAQGAPTVNPTVAPTGQTHTRALGAPTVNPTLAPASLAHARAQGAPDVTVTLPVPTVIRVTQPRHAVRARPVTRILGGLVPTPPSPNPSPPSLDRSSTRALGQPTVTAQAQDLPVFLFPGATRNVLRRIPASTRAPRYTAGTELHAYAEIPGASPASLTRTRALGDPTLSSPFPIRRLGNPTVTVAWIPRPTGLAHTRAQGSPTAHGHADITVTSLTRTRAQGNPKLSGRVLPASITHTRTQGAASVNAKTLNPTGLTRTRAQGAPIVTIAWNLRPTAITHTRTIGSTTIRGHQDVTLTALTRTRAQGTPKLSGRVLPSSLTRTRSLGSPAVNVRTLVPVALARA